MNFSHLHLHTSASLRDGASPVKAFIEKAIENKQTSFAISEHGHLYSHIDFYIQAKKAGIKPIIASELYLADDHLVKSKVKTAKEKREASEVFSEEKNAKGKRAFHLSVISKNNIGYKNLIKLVSIANKDGFYYKPRIDKNLLHQYGEGLIVLSGCLGGEINQAILQDDLEAAENVVKEYLDIFGKDFYLEVMNHFDPDNEKTNSILARFGKKYNIKLVATNDCHYARKEDSLVQDALIALRDNTTINDPNLKKFKSNDFYMKSTEEMYALFPNNPEYLETSYEIAEQCNVEIKADKIAFPEFVKGKEAKEKLLKELCINGWNRKIKPNLAFDSDKKILGDRVKYEMDVINKNGFTDYFLVVEDIVRFAKSNGIPVGPGRGSAAGSLVSNLLDITDINPTDYGLYFERFLNPSRISPPDIDLDFADNRRDEVIEYTKEKYGRDKVIKVLTYGNYKPRIAIKDALRVYGYDINLQNQITQLVPDKIEGESSITFENSYKDVPELLAYKEQYPEVFWLAEKLEKNPRQVSTHASAYVISDKDLTEYAPLDYDAKNDELRLGIDMYSAEFLNLLKVDFLGIETLSLMDNTIKNVKSRYNEVIDIKKIRFDDAKTWKLIQTGDTVGIFQFESEGMRDLLKKTRPKTINELAECNGIFRPGAAKFIKDYISVKNGVKEPEYFHPLMKSVLQETSSVLIFQEQVMKMCEYLAGFTPGDADYMRKAIGKKKKEDMDILKPKFAKGCKKNGIDDILVEKILDWFNEMSRYNFNKSHAVAYSIVAYQAAYLKAHYPLEFQLSFLNKKIKELSDYATRFHDGKKRQIKTLGPDINFSNFEFSIFDDTVGYSKKDGQVKKSRIYFGLNLIKGVASGTVEEVIKERTTNGNYKTLDDFLRRTNEFLDKKTFEGLIYSGALDALGINRKALIGRVEAILKVFKKAKKKNVDQLDMFSEKETGIDPNLLNFQGEKDFDELEGLELEREHTGVYCTGSPLEKYNHLLLDDSMSFSVDINQKSNGDLVKLGCIIKSSRLFKDKNGNNMASFEGEDDFGKIKCVVFSKTFDKYKSKIKENNPTMVLGKVNNGSILVDKIELLQV